MPDQTPINSSCNRISRVLRLRATAVSCCVALLAFSILTGTLHIVDIYFPIMEKTATIATLSAAVITAFVLIMALAMVKKRINGMAIARKAEHIYPEFNGALICAVEKEQIEEADRTLFEDLLVQDIDEKLHDKELTAKILAGRLTTGRTLLCFAATAICLWGASNSRIVKKSLFHLQGTTGITITPKVLQAPVDTDFTVAATVNRWEQNAEIEIYKADETVRYPMLNSEDQFLFTFYGVTEDIHFRIITPSLVSEIKTLEVFTPPTAENLRITLTPPEYCGMKTSSFNALQDLSALEGTAFTCSCNLMPTGTTGSIIFNNKEIKLEHKEHSDEMSMLVTETGEYKLFMRDKAGRTVSSSIFKLEMIPDLAPVVSVISPGKDSRFSPEKKLELQAVASDDFGITKVSLHYSIAGKEYVKTIFKAKATERVNDRTIKSAIDPTKLELKNGNVVKYYFTVEDNRQPETLKARSEIFFATVFKAPDKSEDKQEAEGEDQKKKKELKLYPLIAELKRTIRLSHDALIYQGEERTSAANDIAKALADLRIQAIKVLDEIKEMASDPNAPLLQDFQLAIDKIKDAETSVRGAMLDESIPLQETALNKLSLIAAELAKNQKKNKGKGKCDKGSEEQQENGKKKEQNGKSLKETLTAMKKALMEIRRQSDRQGALNKDMRHYAGQKIPPTERQQLSQRQNEIRRSVQEVNDMLKALEGLKPVKQRLEDAAKAENNAAMNLQTGNSSPALRSGVRSHNDLLAAASSLNEQINSFVSNEIKAMSEAAKRLASKQHEAAEKSKSLQSQPKEETEKAKDLQQQIKKYSDNLQDAVREMSAQVDELYPEVAEALRKVMSELKKQRFESNIKKSSNALNYRRFDKAEKYQRKAADTLQRMGHALDRSRDKLPGMSHDRLMQALQQMMNMKQQVRELAKNNDAKGMEQLKKQLSNALGELARGMKNGQMSQLQTTSEMLPQASHGNIKPVAGAAYQLMNEATAIIKNQLLKIELESHIELNRKTSKPPEKYREQIEEYFKLLSE